MALPVAGLSLAETSWISIESTKVRLPPGWQGPCRELKCRVFVHRGSHAGGDESRYVRAGETRALRGQVESKWVRCLAFCGRGEASLLPRLDGRVFLSSDASIHQIRTTFLKKLLIE